MLLELWGIEIAKGIGKLFINPLFYFSIILVSIIGISRINNERKQFGVKLFGMFSEIKHTWLLSIVVSSLLSILSLLFGAIFTIEIIIILFIVTIVLSLFKSTNALSSTYILSITYLVFLVLPITNIIDMDYYLANQSIPIIIFTTLAFLTGLLLFVEGWMIGSKKNYPTYPKVTVGKRGVWIGEHDVRKLMFIPFFAFIPLQVGTGVVPILPYFHFNGEVYSLILIPIIFGFNYRIRGELPIHATKKLAKSTMILGLVVTILTGISLMFHDLSLLAVMIAFIGKFIINWRYKSKDKKKTPYFRPLKQGIRVLALITNGPADRLGIEIGETILKVNGEIVTNPDEFYIALQNSGAFFKLEVLDVNGENRFITSAFYEEDHHELGIIFQGTEYRS